MQNHLSIETILSQEIDPAFSKRARFIIESIIDAKPEKILDAGCGRGFYPKLTSLLDFPTEVRGIDITPEYVEKAQKLTKNDPRVKISTGSIYALPFPDNHFDCVICSEVLEHLDKPDKAVAEISRVLKKGGMILASVPNNNFPFLWDPLNWILMKIFHTHVPKHIWWLAGIWADHERLYTEKEFAETLSTKFSIKKTQRIHSWSWPFSHFLLYGIGKNLVELGSADTFNRFSFTKRPVSRILAAIIALPSSLFDDRLRTGSSVNIAIRAVKRT